MSYNRIEEFIKDLWDILNTLETYINTENLIKEYIGKWQRVLNNWGNLTDEEAGE